MIDSDPLAKLNVWAIAASLAFIALMIAGIFWTVELWFMVPATVAIWAALKFSLFAGPD